MSVVNSVAFANRLLINEVRSLRTRITQYEDLIADYPELVAEVKA
jgi:hypothetical protein